MKEAMILNIVKVLEDEQVKATAVLADKIWHEHFASILSIDQIDYMIEKFQSYEAINDQISNQGFQYFLLSDEDGEFGYSAIKIEDGKLFLSKIYILKDRRGRGYARKTIDYYIDLCINNKLNAIWLTVNKNNLDTVNIYKKLGFEIIRTQVKDIGNGYVMDDYIMEKNI